MTCFLLISTASAHTSICPSPTGLQHMGLFLLAPALRSLVILLPVYETSVPLTLCPAKLLFRSQSNCITPGKLLISPKLGLRPLCCITPHLIHLKLFNLMGVIICMNWLRSVCVPVIFSCLPLWRRGPCLTLVSQDVFEHQTIEYICLLY